MKFRSFPGDSDERGLYYCMIISKVHEIGIVTRRSDWQLRRELSKFGQRTKLLVVDEWVDMFLLNGKEPKLLVVYDEWMSS